MDDTLISYFLWVSIIMLPFYLITSLWTRCWRKKEVVNMSTEHLYINRQISKLQTQMNVLKSTTDGLALSIYNLSSELKTRNEADTEIYDQHEQQTEKLREEIGNLQEKLEKFGEMTLNKLDLVYNANFLPDEDDNSSSEYTP
jgi:chromosome segregation ATPase